MLYIVTNFQICFHALQFKSTILGVKCVLLAIHLVSCIINGMWIDIVFYSFHCRKIRKEFVDEEAELSGIYSTHIVNLICVKKKNTHKKKHTIDKNAKLKKATFSLRLFLYHRSIFHTFSTWNIKGIWFYYLLIASCQATNISCIVWMKIMNQNVKLKDLKCWYIQICHGFFWKETSLKYFWLCRNSELKNLQIIYTFFVGIDKSHPSFVNSVYSPVNFFWLLCLWQT